MRSADAVRAAIAGFVPAFKVTSGGAGDRLRAASSGGGGLQFAVSGPSSSSCRLRSRRCFRGRCSAWGGTSGKRQVHTFRPKPFSRPRLKWIAFDGVRRSGDTVPVVRAMRLETRYNALADRLRQDPGVLDVTYADQMPQLLRGGRRSRSTRVRPLSRAKHLADGFYCTGVCPSIRDSSTWCAHPCSAAGR